MTAESQDYLSLDYPIYVYPDRCTDGSFCYVAVHPDLPGCAAHGDTMEQARERLDGAREAYIRHLLNEGAEVPEPSAEGPTEVTWQSELGREPDDSEWTRGVQVV